MSRIGKMPVPVPDAVKVVINGRTISAEGPKGKMQLDLPELTDAKLEESQVVVTRESEVKRARAMHGLARALINNMVVGVEKGFVKKLEIHGVGFKAALQGKVLNLQLGYSHDVDIDVPEGIEIKTPDNTTVEISGIDKQKVGQVAAEIRRWRKPEPYKGKGIKYAGEFIFRKEGKKK